MQANVRDIPDGARLFGAGLKSWLSRPGAMALSAAPALIVGALLTLVVFLVVPHTYGFASAMTGFADGWPLWASETVRITLALALDVALIVLCILSFVTLTLALGAPFHERIWRDTERRMGTLVEAPNRTLGEEIGKGLGDAARMLASALKTAALAFLLGLIPVVGGLAAAVFGAYRGSRALAIELSAFAGDARGWSLDERRRRIDGQPLLSLSCAFPVYLACLIPVLSVVVIPVGVVAGTLLVHRLDGDDDPLGMPLGEAG